MPCKIMKSAKGILFCLHLHPLPQFSVIFDQIWICAFQRLSSKRQTVGFHLEQAFHVQENPANSNSEGKRKSVRVSAVSSYRGRLKYSIF